MANPSDPRATTEHLTFRRATRSDVPAIVAMLADDELGAVRERTSAEELEPYLRAFDDVAADPNQFLCVAEQAAAVVGTLQLTFIPGLSRGGSRRGQIEAVRVARANRGHGIGASLIQWAIERCRENGCALVQLTTDKERGGALRFYQGLGVTASHGGLKLKIGGRAVRRHKLAGGLC